VPKLYEFSVVMQYTLKKYHQMTFLVSPFFIFNIAYVILALTPKANLHIVLSQKNKFLSSVEKVTF